MVSPVNGRLKMCIDHLRLLRLPEVLRITGLSRYTIYRMMAKGQFPAQVSTTGLRAVGWRRKDILKWVKDRPDKVSQ